MLQKQAQDMGFPPGVDLGDTFKNMFKMIEHMRNHLDKGSPQ